jgi:hypothetical protein
MTTKMRKQIYIEPDQEVILKRLSRETGMSEAQIIRQAIDHHTRLLRPSRRDLRAWEEERAFIAYLIQQGPVLGERAWQRKDLYEQ